MKRTVKSFLCAALSSAICLGAAVGAYASSYRNSFSVGEGMVTAGEVVFADGNFDNLGTAGETNSDGYNQYNYATVTGETGSVQHNAGSGQYIKQITEDDQNKALQIAGKMYTRISGANALEQKKYRVDMNFKLSGGTEKAYKTILESGVGVTFTDDQSKTTTGRLGALIARNANGKLTYTYFNGTSNTTVDTGIVISNDQWYNLSVLIDIPGKGFSVWVNGRKIVDKTNGLYLDVTSIADKDYSYTTTWHTFRIDSNQSSYASTNKMITVDDIKIYYEPTGYEKFWAEDFSAVKGQSVTAEAAFYGDNNTYNSWANSSVNSEGVLVAASESSSTWATFRVGTNKNNDSANNVGTAYAAKLDFMVPTKAALTSGTKNILIMRGDGSNGGFRAVIDTSGKLFGCEIEPGAWYTLVMYADITNIDYTNKTGAKGAAYLAKRGEALKCVAPELAFNFKADSTTGGDKLYRPFEYNIAKSTVYFDNIAIYKDVREADLSAAAKTFGNTNALGTNNKTITIPTNATNGYKLSWTKDNTAVTADETAVFEGTEAKTVTYTASAADKDDAYTLTRTFDITIPAKYALGLTASGSQSTAEITVNANDEDEDGYKNGLAILALYQDNVLKKTTIAKVTDGKANLSYDPKSEGTFTAKLFLWMNDTLKPLASKTNTFTYKAN